MIAKKLAKIEYNSPCFLDNGRMVINSSDPQGLRTSEVQKLGFQLEVNGEITVEVYTRNSIYIVTGVPHNNFLALAKQTKELQLATA